MSRILETRPTYCLHVDGQHQTSLRSVSLGPNQLAWLRRNVTAFKRAEELWMSVRQDAMRSARVNDGHLNTRP